MAQVKGRMPVMSPNEDGSVHSPINCRGHITLTARWAIVPLPQDTLWDEIRPLRKSS